MNLKEIYRKKRLMIIKPVLIWLCLGMALLAPLTVTTFTLDHTSADTCGASTSDPHYFAYNSFPGFEY